MRIGLLVPMPPVFFGNHTTARRYAAHFRALGHRVRFLQTYAGEALDLLVALHARRSAKGLARYRRLCGGPAVLVLTGTDLYRDLRRRGAVAESLALADRLVVLQPEAVRALPPGHRDRVVVIYQSAPPTRPRPPRRRGILEVAVLANLRRVKDPLRAALAVRRLAPELPVRVLHAGAAMDRRLERQARRETLANPRYRWLGPLRAPTARRLLARSFLAVVSSRLEGGANVVVEAIVDGVPLLASHIPGNVGLLGADYPGYFPAGDTGALAALLERAVTEAPFRAHLARAVRSLRPRHHPEGERAAWRSLIADVTGSSP